MKSNKSTYRYLLIPFSASPQAGDSMRYCTRETPLPAEVIGNFNGMVVYLGNDGEVLTGHMHTVRVDEVS